MAIQTATMRNALAAEYASLALYGALYSTTPGSSPGTELSGGSPAYARKSLSWSGTNPITASATFDIESGDTVGGAGVHSASTGGTYYDGADLTDQAFASQGTYALTLTFTVT